VWGRNRRHRHLHTWLLLCQNKKVAPFRGRFSICFGVTTRPRSVACCPLLRRPWCHLYHLSRVTDFKIGDEWCDTSDLDSYFRSNGICEIQILIVLCSAGKEILKIESAILISCGRSLGTGPGTFRLTDAPWTIAPLGSLTVPSKAPRMCEQLHEDLA